MGIQHQDVDARVVLECNSVSVPVCQIPAAQGVDIKLLAVHLTDLSANRWFFDRPVFQVGAPVDRIIDPAEEAAVII